MLSAETREELKRALRLSGLMLAAVCIVATSLITNHVGSSLGAVTVSILAAMLAAVAAAAVLSAGELRLSAAPLLPAVGLAFVVIAVTGLFAAHAAPAGDLLEAWIVYSIVAVSVAALAARRCECRFVLAAVLATASIVAAYGIFQRYVGLAALREQFERNPQAFEQVRHAFGGKSRLASDRVYGNFVLPNSLAGYLGLVLPLSMAACAAAWRDKRRVSVRIALGAAAVLCLWCLVLTGSKGGAATAALGVAVFFAVKCWGAARRRPGAVLGAVVAAGALGILLVMAAPRSIPGMTGAKLSMSVRVNYWRAAGRMMREHPLGVGPGAFGDNYTRYKVADGWEARHPHNIYLNWAAEGGILGLAALIVLLGSLARSVPGTDGSSGPEPDTKDGPERLGAGTYARGEPYEKKLRSFGLLGGMAAFAILYMGPGILDSASIGQLFLGFTGEELVVPATDEGDARIAAQRTVLSSPAGGLEAGTSLDEPRKIAALRAAGVKAVAVHDPEKRGLLTAFTAGVHLLFPLLWCGIFLAVYACPLGREWWAAALAGGFAAFAAHGLVDLDDTVPGIMATLLALGSAGAAARANWGESPVRITGLRGRRGKVAAAAAAAALAFFVVIRVYPSVIAAQATAFVDPVIRMGPASDLPEAIRQLRYAARRRPSDDRLQMLLYMAYRKTAPMVPPSDAAALETEATRVARLRTELNPASHIPHEQLGHRLMVIGDFRGAADAYRRAAERYPLRPMEWFYFGDALALSGRPGEAVVSYLRGAAVDRTVTDERCVLVSVPFFRYFALTRSAQVERKLAGRLDDMLAAARSPEAGRVLRLRRAILYVTEHHAAARSGGIGAAIAQAKALGLASELLEELSGLEDDPQAMLVLGAIYSAASPVAGSPQRRRAAELWERAGEVNADAPDSVRVRPEVAAEYARRGRWMRQQAEGARQAR